MSIYNITLITMTALAVVVFVALYFFKAGYGFLRTPEWGPSIPNRIGWVLMEAPIFITMLALYLDSDRVGDPAIIVITLLFLTHYLQRTFIFPLLIRGESKMPLAINTMGMIFNFTNAYMQGTGSTISLRRICTR